MRSEKAELLFLYCESPVHWGTGTSVGVVDLPIQRERHTDYPMGQASGIKGALREWFERRPDADKAAIIAAFGPDTNASDHAGCVAFGDARLVLFPVRSLRGTFAYCTSRLLLARLERDLALAGRDDNLFDGVPDSEQAVVAPNSPLLIDQRVVLEEYPVDAQVSPTVEKIGKVIGELAAPKVPKDFWSKRVGSHMCVLPEDLFRDLARMATTVETHVRIDNKTGTADEGGLFYEELLPSDAVLYAPLVVCQPMTSGVEFPKVQTLIRAVDGTRVQMGAGATTGRGIVLCHLLGAKA